MKKSELLRNWSVIFILAFAVRAAFVLLAPARPMTLDDSAQWNRTALRFLSGTGFTENAADLDAKRPPVYPLFLAGTYAAFGAENFTAAKLAQAFLGALTCSTLFAIALILCGPRIALLTGGLCAIYPPLIVYTGILQSETLFAALLALFALMLLIVRDHQTRWPVAAAGVLLGVMNFCRGTILAFPLVLLGFALAVPEERRNLKRYLVLTVISFAVIAPWTLRNLKVYGRPVPVATGGAEMFWFGTLSLHDQELFGDTPSYRMFDGLGPMEAEDAFKKEAWKNIGAAPFTYLLRTACKSVVFWVQPVGQKLAARASPVLGIAAYLAHALLIALSVFGIVQSRRYWKHFALIYLIVGYFALVHTVTVPMPRYRLPVEPFVLLFAAAGLEAVARRKEAGPNPS